MVAVCLQPLTVGIGGVEQLRWHRATDWPSFDGIGAERLRRDVADI